MRSVIRIILSVFVMLFGLTLFVLPLAWMFIAAFQVHPGMGISPNPPTLDNFYTVLIERMDVSASFINSLIIAGFSTIFCVTLASLAAYAFSRSKFRYTNFILFPILLFSTLPITIIMVPIYSEALLLNIQNTLLAVVLFQTALTMPFAIILLKGFVDRIPKDYDEAAMVDGAPPIKAFFMIDFPLMKNGIFVVGLFTFANGWGNFFLPLILLSRPEILPASIKLYSLYSAYGGVDVGEIAAFAFVYALPLLVIYYFLGKYLGTVVVSGLKG
jgi:multiple sugar transport system permease protein